MSATAGDGNEVSEGTVVIDEASGDLGIVRRVSSSGRVAEVEFRGSASDLIDLDDLRVAADQDWLP